MIHGEKKLNFQELWRIGWGHSPAYTVFSQPASALTTILRDHAILIDDLLNEAYVVTAPVIQLIDISPSTGEWVAVDFLSICEKS